MSFEFNDIAKIKDRRIQTIAENCNADPEFTKGILFEEFQEKYSNCEIYLTENIKKFQDDVVKAISDSSDENQAAQILEKAKKDLSKLTPKTIVDSRGHKRTVWVKVNEEKKSTSKESENSNDLNFTENQDINRWANENKSRLKRGITGFYSNTFFPEFYDKFKESTEKKGEKMEVSKQEHKKMFDEGKYDGDLGRLRKLLLTKFPESKVKEALAFDNMRSFLQKDKEKNADEGVKRLINFMESNELKG